MEIKLKHPSGKVEDAQIQAWKQKYKEVYTVEIDDKDTTYFGYLRKPNIRDLTEVSRKSLFISEEGDIQQNTVEAGICFIDLCWLGGDEKIRTDDDLLFAASQKVQTMYETKVVRLKKN